MVLNLKELCLDVCLDESCFCCEQVLANADNIKIANPDYSSTIVYRRAERADTGAYKITVTNEYGSDTADINVIVIGKL